MTRTAIALFTLLFGAAFGHPDLFLGQSRWAWDLAGGYGRSFGAGGVELEARAGHTLGSASRARHRLGASIAWLRAGMPTQPLPSLNHRRLLTFMGRYEVQFAPSRQVSQELFVGAGIAHHRTTDNPFLVAVGAATAVRPEDLVDHGQAGPAFAAGTGVQVRLGRGAAGVLRTGVVYHPVIPGATTSWGWRASMGVRLWPSASSQTRP